MHIIMRNIQKTGLFIFIAGLLVFIGSLSLSNFRLTAEIIDDRIGATTKATYLKKAAETLHITDREYRSKFGFIRDLKISFNKANDLLLADYGFTREDVDRIMAHITTPGVYSEEAVAAAFGNGSIDISRQEKFRGSTSWMASQTYHNNAALRKAMEQKLPDLNQEVLQGVGFQGYALSEYTFKITKSASEGILTDHLRAIFILSFLGTILGALLFIVPQFKEGPPGIKNNGIFHHPATNRGWLGMIVGGMLILFYIFLYWFPEYITNWTLLLDPVKKWLGGPDAEADRWFLYGFLYTLVMLVMGIRMFAKYRGNAYQMVRTTSVLFFQTGFAFIIPEIMARFNLPARDLKNAWPLDYTGFYDYNLEALTTGGGTGKAILFWMIGLAVIVVPVMVYFFGKRWYCSWVCGCGGLAETLGDPYRQLSDKSLKSWKIERWMVYSVMVFVYLMTLAVVYTYLPTAEQATPDKWFTKGNFIALIWVAMAIGMGLLFYWQKQRERFSKKTFLTMMGISGAVLMVIGISHFVLKAENLFFFNSYQVRAWYGFLIGSAFAGVVGTGFYPLMGNRVWCRFGCPLAAFMGLIQRIKSRFRITTNGGQCISCGNCSTYCEMGIDVRAYAQRGQNIVRSSCVGCGVCSAVCPRGVLKLENGPDNPERIQENPIIIGNDGVALNLKNSGK